MAVTVVIATAGALLLTIVSVLAYGAALPADWIGVVSAYLVAAVSFAALGALLGFLLPTARAAQGLGVLLFFVFMMLGGAGPPKEVLPTVLSRIADGIPVTQAGALMRGPWTGDGWDGQALLFMLALLVLSLALTAWRLRWEVEG
jgi:ABC-2 type transport system permease protein